jgi:hypothetical protein
MRVIGAGHVARFYSEGGGRTLRMHAIGTSYR